MKSAYIVFVVSVAFVAATHDNGKVSFRWKNAISADGWSYLGKYCFGYSSFKTGPGSTGGQQQIGNIELVVRSSVNYENLTVLIYDDEPNSWGMAGKADVPCPERYKYAKDFSKAQHFQVHFDPSTQLWRIPQTPLYEHLRPRFWYVVLARCQNEKPDDRHFDVEVDLKWTDEGVYDNGMGPSQCEDKGVRVSSTQVALGVFIGIFGLITIVLGFYVKAQRQNLKAGRGTRVGQEEA